MSEKTSSGSESSRPGVANEVTVSRTATQWGVYDVHVRAGEVVGVEPLAIDPDPSPIGQALVDTVRHPTRIDRPMVRKGWLEHRDRRRELRGREPFVEIGWDRALELAAGELARVKRDHGNEAIYGGSYGWASAGRFHHAQSQLHRFLDLFGGSTRSVNSYSTAAAQVILPHVVAPWHEVEVQQTTWSELAEGCELLVAFGGTPLKNSQVSYGGITEHQTRPGVLAAARRGVRFVNVGPQRGDVPEFAEQEWIALRPGTDVALMLGLAHTLEAEGLVARDFLASHTVGYERFRAYLLGETDGQPKDARWAAEVCSVEPERIVSLARQMATQCTFLNAAWSLQRAEHGEQPYWMLIVLAAMVGDIGKIGGGFGFGYSAEGFVGSDWRRFDWATFPKGRNPTGLAIPVARVADMLLDPGGRVAYDGREIRYPHVELIYWAGGNPFHHHQDLNRLREAWCRPATVIVNEPWWTPVARHADIVFPATSPLEREDICASSHDPYAHAMRRALEPWAESRSDHQIFKGLAERLGLLDEFTEGRDEEQWLRWMWDESMERAVQQGFELPSFDAFWQEGQVQLPAVTDAKAWLSDFRADPGAHPLPTPSGKIEIFSEVIDSFGYIDCPGHPVWLEPSEWLGSPTSNAKRHPLHLVSNQPRHRLHSQLDQSSQSRQFKVAGREVLRMHPQDASVRAIEAGQTVRVFNDRGQCLAGAVIDGDLLPGVVELPTGSWFDPFEAEEGMPLELSGNPNVLTRDRGTSSLAQGSSAHTCMVNVERYDGDAPLPRVYDPPAIERFE